MVFVMLWWVGCEVDVVGDGVEGIVKIKVNEYDVVLMDWYMLELNGFEVIVVVCCEFLVVC